MLSGLMLPCSVEVSSDPAASRVPSTMLWGTKPGLPLEDSGFGRFAGPEGLRGLCHAERQPRLGHGNSSCMKNMDSTNYIAQRTRGTIQHRGLCGVCFGRMD